MFRGKITFCQNLISYINPICNFVIMVKGQRIKKLSILYNNMLLNTLLIYINLLFYIITFIGLFKINHLNNKYMYTYRYVCMNPHPPTNYSYADKLHADKINILLNVCW